MAWSASSSRSTSSSSSSLLAGTVWSVARPDRRIWPPPGPGSWQYVVTWILSFVACGLNASLLVLAWNSWVFPGRLRLLVGIPLALLGAVLALWGVRSVGWKNSSGLGDGFLTAGPYRFTRNPQYLGDDVLSLGLGIIANSELSGSPTRCSPSSSSSPR